MKLIDKLKIAVVAVLTAPQLLSAQLPAAKIDSLVQETLKAFDVPGISIGIFKDSVVYEKGYGLRSLKNGKPMDANTLVGIASNSKGFTCMALGMLVDAGKLNWDDKVRKYIPEFQLKDPFATEEFTIRDLVTHRSGLPLGAGDLMFFPDGNDFTVQDVIDHVKYLEPETSFRTTFRYNNNMFIIAGEIVKRVSGMSWEDFIETRIMKPVGMVNSKASYDRITDRSDIIDAHATADGKVIAIRHDWSKTADAAGGIVSNIPDMLTWAEFLMNGGLTKSGERLISEKQMHNLWSLQTPIDVPDTNPYDTHFRGYGLGWFLNDVKGGYKEVSHTGGLIGTVTQFTLIPELKLAIVVLTNQMSGAAFYTITNTIKDSYLGYGDRNWLQRFDTRNKGFIKYNDSIKKAVFSRVEIMKSNGCTPKPEQITGTYTDTWFGDVKIENTENGLTISCIRSPRLHGVLLPYNETTYVAKWSDRSYDADAYVLFTLDQSGKAVSATLKAIAPITDFSFDFHDLKLKRKE